MTMKDFFEVVSTVGSFKKTPGLNQKDYGGVLEVSWQLAHKPSGLRFYVKVFANNIYDVYAESNNQALNQLRPEISILLFNKWIADETCNWINKTKLERTKESIAWQFLCEEFKPLYKEFPNLGRALSEFWQGKEELKGNLFMDLARDPKKLEIRFYKTSVIVNPPFENTEVEVFYLGYLRYEPVGCNIVFSSISADLEIGPGFRELKGTLLANCNNFNCRDLSVRRWEEK